jgi:hypothetical protein
VHKSGCQFDRQEVTLRRTHSHKEKYLSLDSARRAFGDSEPRRNHRVPATGLAPGNSAESAILTSLPAGNFTGIVSGKNGATGVALVEVYQLP